jgi:hypothetical protein
MAIRYFIFALFSISLISLFISIEKVKDAKKIEEKPTMIFDNAKMYTITTTGVEKFLDAKKTLIYNTKEEAHEAKVVIKTKDNKVYDTVLTDYVLKRGDKITLLGNVVFTRGDFIKVTTDEMYYDMKQKNAYNTKKFVAYYRDNKFIGDNFSSKDNYYITSKNVNFNIKLKD